MEETRKRDIAYYYLTHPDVWWSHLKWAWQRVFRGWDDRVLWSLDAYLAENMIVWLGLLKGGKMGVPSVFVSDEAYAKPDGPDNEDVELARAKWEVQLDMMIDGWKAALVIINEDYEAWSEVNRYMRIWKDQLSFNAQLDYHHFLFQFFDVPLKREREYNELMKTYWMGMTAFAEYFFSLWT